MKARSARVVRAFFPPLLVFVTIVAALEIWLRWRHTPSYLFPTPSSVLLALGERKAQLLAGLFWTSAAALSGFAASTILGILLAICLAGSRFARRAIYPYTLFFQTVPIVAIAPLLVFWMDVGLEPVIVCAFIVSVFPVIANTMTGLISTDPALVDLFRLYGATPIARLWKLRLPAALPSIFTGLRVAAGLSVIGTVVAEFLVGTFGEREGLGVRIMENLKYAHQDRVFAAVLLASLLGLAMFAGVNGIAYIALRRWHASESGATA